MNPYRWFWKKVARFAYRRWAAREPVKPVGVPGNRDPEHPCDSYSPRKWRIGDWNDCRTDGHYLCLECCHRSPNVDEDLAAGRATFSDLQPRSVEQINSWFYEFIGEHMNRHPSRDWPATDFEAMQALFSPWKAAFVKYGIDRDTASKASMFMKSLPIIPVYEHLAKILKLSGKASPDVENIRLWGG